MGLRKVLSLAAGWLLAAVAAVFLLAGLLEVCGTGQALMESVMVECAPPEVTGIDRAEYGGITLMITRYLAGAVKEFSYTADDGYGRMVELFNETEREHMADCLALFRLDRLVMLISAAAVMVLGGALLLWGDRRRAALGIMLGSVTALTGVTVIAVWAAVDFDGLFVLFHRISFSNELWIMDPARDLIVRLMPIGFFVRYVTGIAVLWILGLVIMGAVSGAAAFRHGRTGNRAKKFSRQRYS